MSQSYPSYAKHPRRSTGRKKPVKSLTAYQYVVRYDLGRKLEVTNSGHSGVTGFYPSPIHDEAYNVMKGELLVQSDNSKQYHDGLHCFSFANGLGLKLDPVNQRQKLVDYAKTNIKGDPTKLAKFKKFLNIVLMQDIQFAGVALTDFNAESNNFTSVMQGFVSTIGGVTTIVNTGTEVINPGQWISIGAPRHTFLDDDDAKRFTPDGVPLDKMLFETVPYSYQRTYQTFQDVKNQWAAINDFKFSFWGGAEPSNGDLFREFVFEEAQRLVIGKALSYARPNECFDIVLGGRPNFFK